MKSTRLIERNRLAVYYLLLVACAVFSPGIAAGAAPQVRRVDLRYTCEIPKIPAGAKTIDVWIPVPIDDQRQTVRLVNESELAEGRFTTEKRFGNRLYYRRFEAPFADPADSSAAGQSPIKIELRYEAEVHEQTIPAAKQLVSTKQVQPGPELAPYLGAVSMIPLDGRVQQLALEVELPEGEPLRAGRRIYDFLIDRMVYNFQAPGAGQGDALWACDSKTGDCTDYHSLFIGICRWRGIPADHVFGLPMPPEKSEGAIRYCHCWARYWVADVGWIPIDASRADKFPSDRDYYFGTIGSTWLTIAHGRDVVLEPPQQGPPINMLHHPVAEVDGTPLKEIRWQAYYKDRPGAANSAAAGK